jgi:dTDP-4-dehydrorhamnose 3,5-epimerase-like enzyme
MNITVDDVKFLDVRTVVDSNGNLIPIESNQDIPFEIKRVFYVYGVRDEERRGKHAHYNTQQVLICLHGKVEVIVKDGLKEKRYLLESPQQALYIPEMIWDEQVYRSEETALLVLSNTRYDPSDYIHNFESYKLMKAKNEN